MEAARSPWPALGVLLIRDGLLSPAELDEILAAQDSDEGRVSNRRLGELLVDRGLVTSGQVARLVAEQHELPFIDLDDPDAIVRMATALSEDLAREHSALPIRRFPDGSLLVVVADPTRPGIFEDIRRALAVPTRFAVAAPEAIDALIEVAAEDERFGAEPEPPAQPLLFVTPAEPPLSTPAEADAVRAELEPGAWPVLGSLLLRDDLVSEDELASALAQQRLSSTRRLGEILVQRGSLTDHQLAQVLAEQHELPFVDLRERDVDHDAASRIPVELARELRALPVSVLPSGSLLVAVTDPTSTVQSDRLRAALDGAVQLAVAVPDELDRALASLGADVVELGMSAPVEQIEEVEADEPDAIHAVVETEDEYDGAEDFAAESEIEIVDDPHDDFGAGVEIADEDVTPYDFEAVVEVVDAADDFEVANDATEDLGAEAEIEGDAADDFEAGAETGDQAEVAFEDDATEDFEAKIEDFALEVVTDDVAAPEEVDVAMEIEVEAAEDVADEEHVEDEDEAAVEIEAEAEAEEARQDAVALVEPAPPTLTVVEGGVPDMTGLITDEIEAALALGASAIHVVSRSDAIVVRARVDDALRDVATIETPELSARVMALTELATLGRARFDVDGRSVELRPAVLPTMLGERVTFRVVGEHAESSSLAELLGTEAADAVREALERRNGLVVLCAPSSTERAATLYAALRETAAPGRTVLSVEDPVEQLVDGVDQLEVDPRAGVTFASGLHAILRSDADIASVSELLDPESVRLATRGALVQSVVLGTLAAGTAVEGARRLLDLGAEAGALAEVLACVVASRRLRAVCLDCRSSSYATLEELTRLGRPPEEAGRRLVAQSTGCNSCDGTGYSGWVRVTEVLPLTDDVRRAVAVGGPREELEQAAAGSGARTLVDAAVELCLEGATTASEIELLLGTEG
jgi:type II secretory ATPase GspE/PulE/Tfp pilus assembly ATPase PilB-like protein